MLAKVQCYKSKHGRRESHTYFWVVTYLKYIANDFSLDYLRMKTLFFVNLIDKSDLKKC